MTDFLAGIAPAEDLDAGDGADGRVLTCEAGGHEWLYTGRATTRLPHDCPDHKVRAPSGPTGSRRSSKLGELEDNLAAWWAKMGRGMGAMLPCTGTVLVARSANTAHAMVELCKPYPKALKALETACKAVPALDLGEFVAMSVTAFAVDTGKLAPDHRMAMLLGITEIHMMIHGGPPPPGAAGRPAGVERPREFVAV